MKISERNRWILAVASLAVGASLLIHALGQTPAARARLQRRTEDLEKLQRHKEQLAVLRKARVLHETTDTVRPKALADIAAEHLHSQSMDIQRLEPINVDADWRQQRVELTFSKATWRDLDAFLHAASSSRPPWVMESARLDAHPKGTGSGRLVLQALERITP